MFRLLPLLLVAGALPFGDEGGVRPFPVEAEGDIPFHLDGARFLERGEIVSELYLSIPENPLTEAPDSTGHSRLMLEIWFEDADGDPIGGAREETWVRLSESRGDGAPVQPRHLLKLHPEIPRDTRAIRARVEDLSGQKTGLLDRIRGVKPHGEARARFVGPPIGCGLSDLVFAWDVVRAGEGERRSLRERLQPNPSRFFGLYHTNLLFYLEQYGEPIGLAYEIQRLPGGEVVAAGSDSSRDEEGNRHPWLIGQDLATFPAGTYRLEVWEQERGQCRVGGDFQILWETSSWTQDREALRDEAYVLLGPNEYEETQGMSPGELESYLAELWRQHDPVPSTGRNELRDVFAERVEYANKFFGTSFREGMLTDRGRVYIRYGPPDEVTKELNPQDQDVLARILPGEVQGDRRDIIQKPGQYDVRDNRAYEIWTYQVRGEPLFPEQMNPVQRTGLKFIFVDDLGYGNMRLIYTNIAGPF
ncbi:MAG: GWxTD domain-containing protein [Candidatus Eisenbacteria bacterium]|nr:GWxTD domain-containing protein [Candidatus Latescibacterota bacterium]MBD3301404.1 GWxTD domain-containing protein [Candidatus Eisenbacteria bacterium]